MKKMVAFLLIVLVACAVFPALAVDLSKMSFDGLVELKAQVDAAIIATGEAEWFDVPQGTYVVGKHIAPGDYTVEMLASEIVSVIIVYKDEKCSGFEGVLNTFSLDKNSGIGCLQLKKGMKIEITYGSTRFKKFVGLGN